MKVYYMIYSWSLIPEVYLYPTKEKLMEVWIDVCLSDGEYTSDEAAKSFNDGFAEWHDIELRWGAENV